MGKFIVNLMNINTKPEVSELFDNLPLHFFVLSILQSTKLVNYSKALNDKFL